MTFHTFGNRGNHRLLLIPGLGVSYEIFLPLIELLKDKDAQQHRPDGSDTCPDGIGDANGDGLCGFRQKHRTQHIEHGKPRNP